MPAKKVHKRIQKPSSSPRKPRDIQKRKAPAPIRSPPESPEGYIFVPKGDVYITRKCTSLTQESGQAVHIVYDNRTKSKVRIGIHIPKSIWKVVQADVASTATQRAAAVQRKDDRDQTKARTLLKDHYPGMPDADLEQVLHHAFLKGSGRVGRTSGESEERKAALAIGAHIRHTYTAYDKLLKEMSREEAREQVRMTVYNIKSNWSRKASKLPLRAA